MEDVETLVKIVQPIVVLVKVQLINVLVVCFPYICNNLLPHVYQVVKQISINKMLHLKLYVVLYVFNVHKLDAVHALQVL